MDWTQYDEVNRILEHLHGGHRQIFGDKLAGFYLYGSLAWGDFDLAVSDIDTLCALTVAITDDDIEHLRILHSEIMDAYPAWRERIEVRYHSLEGLRHFREKPYKMGNVSPGEPLHILWAGIEWLDDWYLIREYGITLYGTDKAEVIPHIHKSEFIQQICRYACGFREQVKESKGCRASQAYVILTLCRALYTLSTGGQASKPAAAKWAMNFLPEYDELIENALVWRQERLIHAQNPDKTYALTEAFVGDILDRFFTSKSNEPEDGLCTSPAASSYSAQTAAARPRWDGNWRGF